mmetsp:Transcript_90219/g.255723  ORF Transcript_90219/g.255723 Transcript_90219/m.255723 type:complete len:591 (+) Transcript_90219:113-1885(+)
MDVRGAPVAADQHDKHCISGHSRSSSSSSSYPLEVTGRVALQFWQWTDDPAPPAKCWWLPATGGYPLPGPMCCSTPNGVGSWAEYWQCPPGHGGCTAPRGLVHVARQQLPPSQPAVGAPSCAGAAPEPGSGALAAASSWGCSAAAALAPRSGRPAFADLPHEVAQAVIDTLPSFQDRARLCRTCCAAAALDWRLAPPCRLEEELSGIGLGDRGACAVARALAAPPNASLGELCLGRNGIGDAGAEAIAAVLGAGSALRRLSLRDNAIGDAGARALAAALSLNGVLEELDLWGNQLSDLGGRALLSAAARCEIFLELDPSPCRPLLAADSAISARMRAILFDWISQVHTGVVPMAADGAADPQDMLFRTFGLVDAYLSRRRVQKTELQLVGAACTLVAAGLEWGAGPGGGDELASWLASVTDGACTPEEVCASARDVRAALGLGLRQPTVYTFLRRFLRRTGWTEGSFSLANYLIELAAIHHAELLPYRPQVVAAAAAILSRQYFLHGIAVRHIPNWKPGLLRCAHVDARRELAPCAAALSRLHASEHGCPNKFVNKKYAWARLHMVAKVPPNPPPDTAFFLRYLAADAGA